MDIFELETKRLPSLPSAIAWQFREARILQVAIRLKLFTTLNQEPQSSGELARTLRTNPAMTERLLIALAALDLVWHDQGTWQNTFPAALYLVEGKPLYQGTHIEQAAELWNRYHHLEQLVRHGPKQDEPLFSLTHQPTYLKAIHAIAIAGRAQRLARLAPIASRRTLLDIGGAPGSYSIALCQRYWNLKATLLDKAKTLAESKATIEQFKLTDRIELKKGDWQHDSWGEASTETLILNHILIESERQALDYLNRALQALKGGGLLIIQSFLLDNDLNGGYNAAMFNLFNDMFTIEQMEALLIEAGFERISLLARHPNDCDIFVAYKPFITLPASQQELVELVTPDLMALEEESPINGHTTHLVERELIHA